MPLKEYEGLLQSRRHWYKCVKKVYCPLLKEDIFFNSKGLNHLLYNGAGHARLLKERILRLKILPLAVPIINKAESIYEHTFRKGFEYWRIEEKMSSFNITVILRKTNKGKVIFYSIWKN